MLVSVSWVMARTRLYPPSVDPAFPRLPPTPPGWRHATFRDVLEVVERPIRLEPEAHYRLVTAKRGRGGITLRSELLGREILTKTQFSTRAGDFLISRRQIIHGACGVVPHELDGAVVSNEYSTLRTRPELLMDFLQHYTHTPYFQRTCFHSSHGVDVEKMLFKIDEWLSRELDLPPIAEQKQIAAILASVDDAIKATRAVIDQLQVVKKAMMADLLTRGLPKRHTRFKQMEIGQVPEGWEVSTLEQVVDSTTTITYGIVQAGPHVENGIPYIRTGDVKPTGIVAIEKLGRTSPEIASKFERSSVRSGDLVLCIRASVGAVAMVTQELSGANLTQGTARIAPGPRVLGRFLLWVLRSEGVQGWINLQCKGSTFREITLGRLRQVPIPVPSIEEQSEIAGALDTIDQRIAIEAASSASLFELKSALLSVLLTGEVRVKPDPEPT